MSVDTLRETFHINRIGSDDLQDFLTAQTYRPEITEAKNIVLSLSNCELQSVCSKPIRQGKSPRYAPNGLKCIKPKNTNDILVSLDDVDWIDVSTRDEVQNQKLEYGDIVITRSGSGTIGRASLFANSEPVYTNDHLFIIRVDKADSHFACAYLKGYYGARQLEAGISGSTGQLNLSNEHIKSLRLYFPDALAQKYIGDKVRQAEQLRAWAKFFRGNVDRFLDELGFPIQETPKKINRIDTLILEDRLDPRPYRTHYLNLTQTIQKTSHDRVDAMAQLSSGCPVSSKDFLENSGIPLIRIRNIGFDGFIGIDTGVEDAVFKEAAKYQASENMIVLGMDGIFRAQFFVMDELPMLINQRVAMIITKDIRAELLTHWLNRPEGQMQLNQWAVKTTVEHTSLVDISRVIIPRLEQEREDEFADALRDARLAFRYSNFLTTTAKFLVEALIEGQLTEKQLIQAQQALEDGDTRLDQKILSKLSETGYATEGGKPLFTDLDELYRLIEAAKNAEENPEAEA